MTAQIANVQISQAMLTRVTLKTFPGHILRVKAGFRLSPQSGVMTVLGDGQTIANVYSSDCLTLWPKSVSVAAEIGVGWDRTENQRRV